MAAFNCLFQHCIYYTEKNYLELLSGPIFLNTSHKLLQCLACILLQALLCVCVCVCVMCTCLKSPVILGEN